MKKIENFKFEAIEFNSMKTFFGGGSGCCDSLDTGSPCGDGTDEIVTYYDEGGNETGSCESDPCKNESCAPC